LSNFAIEKSKVLEFDVADLEDEPIRKTRTYQHLSDGIIPGSSNASIKESSGDRGGFCG